jgi:hypothetical protein
MNCYLIGIRLTIFQFSFFSPTPAFKMMHLARKRREGERQRKIEDCFREADFKGEGRLNKEGVLKLFAAQNVESE